MPDPEAKLDPQAQSDVALRTDASDAAPDTPVRDSRPTVVTAGAESAHLAAAVREHRSGRKAAGETTLLSAPAPADRSDFELEDRLLDCERKLSALEDRIQQLETRGAPRGSDQRWLVWVVFLVALAVAWQLFRTPR